MPEGSLIDILWPTDRVLHYTRHFSPLSGLEPTLEDPRQSYCLTLFSMASGLGVAQAAQHMRGLITESALSRLNRRHITAGKLEAAQTDFLK